ncbi:MAG: penicillin-binding transpeptidase domain-containing protein [Eubacteriales bacterium]|nr:penicillin-binding transpeptidase domain-containing protein [Eubacteriales bacterium]
MKEIIRNVRYILYVFMGLTAALLLGLLVQSYRAQTELSAVAGENRAALAERYGLLAGRIISSDGFVIAESVDGQRRYPAKPYSDPYVHLVGDYSHIMANSIEANYEGQLLGTQRNLIDQVVLDVNGYGMHGNELVLTLNNSISQTMADQFRATGYRGAAVMLNWKTGDLIAACSFPAPSYEQVISYDNLEDTALFNRVLNGLYTPGSTFKVFTSAAYFDSTLYDPDYTITCDGNPIAPGGPRNYANQAHGLENISGAFTASCNVFFGNLGYRLGQGYLTQFFEDIGFSDQIQLDRLSVTRQKLAINSDDSTTLSWFAIGQPNAEAEAQVNPLMQACYASAIANGGKRLKPHIVRRIVDPLGRTSYTAEPELEREVFDEETSEFLRSLMIACGNTLGLSFNGVEIGLKTGTAEVDGLDGNYSWVNTFIDDENYPYALALVFEDSPGSQYLIPYAQNIYRQAMNVQP